MEHPAIHYLVKGTLISNIHTEDDVDCFAIKQEFYHANPIEARMAAMNYYQNYVDVLLQAMPAGPAGEDAETFLIKRYIDPLYPHGTDATQRHLGVYMQVDQRTKLPVINEVAGEYIIHALSDNTELEFSCDMQAHGLHIEWALYQHYGYAVNNMARIVDYCDRFLWEENELRDQLPYAFHILETPRCWDGLDQPYWWDAKKSEEMGRPMENPGILVLISLGEHSEVAFLSAAVFGAGTCFEAKPAGLLRMASILSALMNNGGGMLLIGVEPDGTVTGATDEVFHLLGGRISRTLYNIELRKLAPLFIRNDEDYLAFNLWIVQGKEVIGLEAYHYNEGPVFINGAQGPEFYIREAQHTIRLQDAKDIKAYCSNKWGGLWQATR